MQNENSFGSWFSTTNPMSGKILVLNFQIWSSPIRLQDSLKCNICKKKLRDQVDFLLADKHHSFWQVSAIAFVGRGQVCPKYPK